MSDESTEVMQSLARIEASIERLVEEWRRANDIRQGWLNLAGSLAQRVGSVIDQPIVRWAVSLLVVVSVARLIGVDVPFLVQWYKAGGV